MKAAAGSCLLVLSVFLLVNAVRGEKEKEKNFGLGGFNEVDGGRPSGWSSFFGGGGGSGSDDVSVPSLSSGVDLSSSGQDELQQEQALLDELVPEIERGIEKEEEGERGPRSPSTTEDAWRGRGPIAPRSSFPSSSRDRGDAVAFSRSSAGGGASKRQSNNKKREEQRARDRLTRQYEDAEVRDDVSQELADAQAIEDELKKEGRLSDSDGSLSSDSQGGPLGSSFSPNQIEQMIDDNQEQKQQQNGSPFVPPEEDEEVIRIPDSGEGGDPLEEMLMDGGGGEGGAPAVPGPFSSSPWGEMEMGRGNDGGEFLLGGEGGPMGNPMGSETNDKSDLSNLFEVFNRANQGDKQEREKGRGQRGGGFGLPPSLSSLFGFPVGEQEEEQPDWAGGVESSSPSSSSLSPSADRDGSEQVDDRMGGGFSSFPFTSLMGGRRGPSPQRNSDRTAERQRREEKDKQKRERRKTPLYSGPAVSPREEEEELLNTLRQLGLEPEPLQQQQQQQEEEEQEPQRVPSSYVPPQRKSSVVQTPPAGPVPVSTSGGSTRTGTGKASRQPKRLGGISAPAPRRASASVGEKPGDLGEGDKPPLPGWRQWTKPMQQSPNAASSSRKELQSPPSKATNSRPSSSWFRSWRSPPASSSSSAPTNSNSRSSSSSVPLAVPAAPSSSSGGWGWGTGVQKQNAATAAGGGGTGRSLEDRLMSSFGSFGRRLAGGGEGSSSPSSSSYSSSTSGTAGAGGSGRSPSSSSPSHLSSLIPSFFLGGGGRGRGGNRGLPLPGTPWQRST
uniref:Uncharacterized protein n=1 Tax=Chromera velia CCMP2878 TaxID=1169474 RepID=A0A0G4GIE6_9ALVE|eukprot:Cvel_21966.t1-p1 / transcript=Cvel_21966.t1 / gene=Cvel_21966 / organism=Chromera_velia_CCMP2878 / gene_product=hypothetical protein / transcript_product=hypothetical protein / location=Cvel_scaffold2111:27067-30882(+) / protein_length=782 / sequence_SO=supercontig / SO=protein_coding / is_pseudo=false